VVGLNAAAGLADVAAMSNEVLGLVTNWDDLTPEHRTAGVLNAAFWGGLGAASVRGGQVDTNAIDLLPLSDRTANFATVATNRVATQADVANHFQQNRRFWSSEPIQFNGNRVFQRNDLFDPDLCPKLPPALRGILGVKSLALGSHPVKTPSNLIAGVAPGLTEFSLAARNFIH